MNTDQKTIEFQIPIILKSTAAAVSLGGVPDNRTLDITYMNQTASNWCWATCAAMLSRFFTNANTKICEVVAILVPTGNCCTGAPAEGDETLTYHNGVCNITCSTNQVTPVHEELKMQSTHNSAAITLDELHKQIAELGSPVEAALAWTGGGGHVVLVRGVNKQAQTVVINDPWPDTGEVIVSFAQLQIAYGRGRWFDSWANIAAKS